MPGPDNHLNCGGEAKELLVEWWIGTPFSPVARGVWFISRETIELGFQNDKVPQESDERACLLNPQWVQKFGSDQPFQRHNGAFMIHSLCE